MKVTVSAVVGAFAGAAAAQTYESGPRNFIYIVPDGYGAASQVLARDYVSILNGDGSVERPNSQQLGADPLVRLLPPTLAQCRVLHG